MLVVVRVLSVSAACAIAAASCTSAVDDGALLGACNLFYRHLDGSGECASCAGGAPAMCNRPGIDAKCSSMASCAKQWCNGAQCQCAGLSKCMADEGSACNQALLDYYSCSNAGCASACGDGADAGGACRCPGGTACPKDDAAQCPTPGGACGFDPNDNGGNAGFGVACGSGLVCVASVCKVPQYRSNGDGTVTDLVTGLLWQQQSPADPCPVDGSGMCTWDHAKAYCATLTLGGSGGWTLPTADQLFSLVDNGFTGAAIDPTFTNGGFVFWSSTSFSPNAQTTYAWTVGYSGNGFVNAADVLGLDFHVRCVR